MKELGYLKLVIEYEDGRGRLLYQKDNYLTYHGRNSEQEGYNRITNHEPYTANIPHWQYQVYNWVTGVTISSSDPG